MWARIRERLKAMWGILIRTIKLYSEIEGEQRAASFAYYVLFSLFPMVALLLTLGSLFFGTDDILAAIGDVLPLGSGQQTFLWESVAALERARGGVGAVSAVILIWSAMRFFQALVRGVNRAWHSVEIPWWQLPLKNLAMLAILGSALFAGLLIPAILQGMGKVLAVADVFLLEHFPSFNFGMAALVLDVSRYFLGVVVLFYSFSMLYMLAPRKRVPFSKVWLPTLLVTIVLQLCQVAFVHYLPRFVNYGIYGTVGGIMLVLMWVYFSGIIIMFGGCLCSALEKGSPSKSH